MTHCVHQKNTVTDLQHQHQNIGNRMECSIEKVMLIIVNMFWSNGKCKHCNLENDNHKLSCPIMKIQVNL
jgi:hypothetical protein